METVSFIGAAQRLGITVAEVRVLIQKRRLREVTKGRVSKDAVYRLSGVVADGCQTKKSKKETTVRRAKAGPIPEATEVTQEKKEELQEEKKEEMKVDCIDEKLVSQIAKDALQRESKEVVELDEEMLREVIGIAYLKGKLSVYESLSEFKREVRA